MYSIVKLFLSPKHFQSLSTGIIPMQQLFHNDYLKQINQFFWNMAHGCN